VIPVTPNLSVTEEWFHYQIFLDITERPQPQKPILLSSPCENVFCTSNTKHDRRLAPKPKVYCGKNITGTKASTTIICPGFNSQ
jgi:hypothetical protein